MFKIERTALIDRNIHLRDAWICVLVTEGELTEKQYFEGLQSSGIINKSRVKIEVVPASSETHDSAPAHVCSRADKFLQKYRLDLEGMDQIWLLMDVDRWGSRNLAQAHQHARERGYQLAISNPSFEIWLLFHLSTDVSGIRNCSDCEERIRQILGSYNKSNLDIRPYTDDSIRDAISRARETCPNPSAWPITTGTCVYLLMEQILPSRRVYA